MPPREDQEKSIIDDRYRTGQGSYGDEPASETEQHEDFSNTERAESHNLMNFVDDRKPGSKAASAKKTFTKAKGLLRKRGPLFGIFGGILMGIGLAAIVGPAAILISLMQTVTGTLDSASRAMSNRSARVLMMKMENGDADQKSCKSFACKKNAISNKTLRKLDAAGFKPLGADGKPMDLSKSSGYPDKTPASYEVDGKTIPAKDISALINSDEKIKGRLFGSKGLFNGRVSAWSGKFIDKVFRKPFGLKSDGGTADGKNKKLEASEKRQAFKEKIKAKIPGVQATDKIASVIEKMLGGDGTKKGRLATAKAGGVAYTVAYTGCLVTKVPSITTAAVAGVQIARLLPYINEIVLSPAAKIQSSGVDSDNSATPEDVDTSASILTEKTLDKDGNYTSAMDSPILLAAMGINKNTISPDVYGKYIPGYAIMKAIPQEWRDVQKEAAPACSVIMSPITMYVWAAVETAISGTNPLIAGAKLLIGFAAGAALAPAVANGAVELAKAMGIDLDDLVAGGFLGEDLEGIELGNVLGASALAFFPAGAMARFVPGVTVGGASAAQASIDTYNNEQRAMDIASLSPFDTSSQYTFLGSIVHSLRINAVATGGYSGGLASALSSIFRMPQLSLNPSAGAQTANSMSSLCNANNASTYDLEAEVASDTPLLNPLGMPCSELDNSLTSEEAISILEDAGMLDTSKEVSDGADIAELVSKGVIKENTELYALANNETACNDAKSGNYLVEAGGCTVRPVVRDTSDHSDSDKIPDDRRDIECSVDGKCEKDNKSAVNNSNLKSSTATFADSTVASDKTLLAAYTFLVDVQAGNAITGEDDIVSSGTNSTAGATIDMENLYKDSTSVACAPGTENVRDDTGYKDGNPVPVKLCALPNTSESGKPGGKGLANSRVSGAAYAMFEKMKTDLGKDSIPLNDSFRTMQDQEDALATYGPGQAAQPGFSNHQMGAAFDIGGGGCAYSAGVTSCENSEMWRWMRDNAASFGYKQLSREWWHWSPDGN